MAASKTAAKRRRFKGGLFGSDADAGLSFRGRLLRIRPAVTRNEASGLTRQAEKDRLLREHVDPRNLRLADEGRVMRGTPIADGLPESRLELLESRYQNKMRHLKDANYFVSPTRLSIRDLPTEVDETELKRLVMLGVRDFTRANPKFTWEQTGKRNPFIKQMRLLRDAASAQSRGFAFVELRQRETALAVLRKLNNNPILFGRNQRLHIEFAVESVHALQRLGRITQKGRVKHKGIAALRREGVADPREDWRRREEATAAAAAAATAAVGGHRTADGEVGAGAGLPPTAAAAAAPSCGDTVAAAPAGGARKRRKLKRRAGA